MSASTSTSLQASMSVVNQQPARPQTTRIKDRTPNNNQAGLGVQLLTAGTAACIADLFTFPLDTAKVRLQVRV